MINYDGQNKNVMSLWDINLAESRTAKRNPESCMGCHGNSSGETKGMAGPRPLFATEPWGRVTDDQFHSTADVNQSLCPNYRNQIENMRTASREALATDPQYRCLKDLPQLEVRAFDRMLVKKNTARVGAQIRASKDYKKFKYAILGSMICGDFDPDKYFPPHQQKLMTNKDSLSKEFRTDAEMSKSELVALANRPSQERLDALKVDASIGGVVNMDKNVPITDGMHCGDREMPPTTEAELAGTNSTYHRYIADVRRLRKGPAFNRFANLKYIFESRGIDISDWNMLPNEEYGRVPDMLFGCPNQPKAQAGQPVVPQGLICDEKLWLGNNDGDIKELHKNKDCDGLAKKSMAAFGKPPEEETEDDKDANKNVQ